METFSPKHLTSESGKYRLTVRECEFKEGDSWQVAIKRDDKPIATFIARYIAKKDQVVLITQCDR